MCTFAALIPAALSIGSSVAGHIGQSQAANSQAKYQNEVYSQTGALALADYQQKTASVVVRSEQNAEQASQTALQEQVTGIQAMARAQTAAGEAGVEGSSVSQLLNDFRRVQAGNQYVLNANLNMQQDQYGQEQKAMQAEAQSRIAQARPGPVQQPSLLATALQIGGAAFEGYDAANRQTNKGVYSAASPSSGSQGHWLFRPLKIGS